MKRTILISLLLLCSLLNLKAVKWENFGTSALVVRCLLTKQNIYTATEKNLGYSLREYDICVKSNSDTSWKFYPNFIKRQNMKYGRIVDFLAFKDTVYLLSLDYPSDQYRISVTTNAGTSWDSVYAPNLIKGKCIKDTIYIWRNDTLYSTTSVSDTNNLTKVFVGKNSQLNFTWPAQFTRINNYFVFYQQNKIYRISDANSIPEKIILPDTTNLITGLYNYDDKLYSVQKYKIYKSDDYGNTNKVFYIGEAKKDYTNFQVSGDTIVFQQSNAYKISFNNGKDFKTLKPNVINSAGEYLYVDSTNVYIFDYDGVRVGRNNGQDWSEVNDTKYMDDLYGSENYYFVRGFGKKLFSNYNRVSEFNDTGNEIIFDTTKKYSKISGDIQPDMSDYLFPVNNKVFYKSRGYEFKFFDITNPQKQYLCVGLDNKHVVCTFKEYNGVLYCLAWADFGKSVDGGLTWNIINKTSVEGDRFCFNNGYIFAGERYYSQDPFPDNKYYGSGIYRSSDGGINWELLENELKGRPVKSLCAKDGNVFVSSYGGVFMSSNNGDTWINISDPRFGLLVGELDANDDYLFAATSESGLGIARLKLPKSLDCANLIFPENTAVNVTGNPVFKWNSTPNAVTYLIRVAKDIDFKNIVYMGETTDTTLKMNGLDLNTKYYWKVKAKFGGVESDWCQNYSFTVGGISGVNDINGEYINVAPNPSNGIINIETKFENEYDLNITIYNILGDVVYSGNNLKATGTIQIDLSGRSSGAYTAVIETGGKKYVKSINILK